MKCPRTLYYLRDEGRLTKVRCGVYRLAELPDLSDPDLVTVAMRVPEAVVRLISALAFHKITTEIPHAIHAAIPRAKRTPTFKYPLLQVYRLSGEALIAGVETHEVDGAEVDNDACASTGRRW